MTGQIPHYFSPAPISQEAFNPVWSITHNGKNIHLKETTLLSVVPESLCRPLNNTSQVFGQVLF